MEIVLIKSCFLYYIHAPHQRFTATSRCSTPIVLQDLDAQHLLQEQHHAQLRPKCQNQVGVILAQILGSRRVLDVYEPSGTAGAPLSPAIRPPSAATAPPSLGAAVDSSAAHLPEQRRAFPTERANADGTRPS